MTSRKKTPSSVRQPVTPEIRAFLRSDFMVSLKPFLKRPLPPLTPEIVRGAATLSSLKDWSNEQRQKFDHFGFWAARHEISDWTAVELFVQSQRLFRFSGRAEGQAWAKSGAKPLFKIVIPVWPGMSRGEVRDRFEEMWREKIEPVIPETRQRKFPYAARDAWLSCEHVFVGTSYGDLGRRWIAMTKEWSQGTIPTTEDTSYRAYVEWTRLPEEERNQDHLTTERIKQIVREWRVLPVFPNHEVKRAKKRR